MKFKLADIRSNPFRDIANYPIDRAKIDALKLSIESTGFWDNLVARQVEGGAEIAYGHHRIKALGEVLPPSAEIDLIVRDLDDATMLRIMADENMQEWTSSAAIEQETIAAVVRAYGAGKIALSPPNGRHDQVRHAPSYLTRSDGSSHPYTKETIAGFLRWPVSKVERALTALAAIESDEVPQETFRGLGSTLSERVVQAAHAAERRAKVAGIAEPQAKAIGRQVATRMADDFRDEGKAIGTALTAHRERLIDEVLPRRERPTVPSKIAEDLYRDIEGFWRVGIPIAGQGIFTRSEVIRLIAANRHAVELQGQMLPWNEQIARVLVEMAGLAQKHADVLMQEDALAIS